MNKNLTIILSFILFLPKLALADIMVPLSFTTIPLIPFIVLIEAFVFWLLVNRWLKVQTGFWKLVLVVFIANIVTSLLGTFIYFYRSVAENLMLISIAFICSVIIEWGLYLPFFWKTNIKKYNLLIISFIANLATYVPLSLIIAFS